MICDKLAILQQQGHEAWVRGGSWDIKGTLGLLYHPQCWSPHFPPSLESCWNFAGTLLTAIPSLTHTAFVFLTLE